MILLLNEGIGALNQIYILIMYIGIMYHFKRNDYRKSILSNLKTLESNIF